MKRLAFVRLGALVAAVLVAFARPASAAGAGSVSGTIVLVRGSLPQGLANAVMVESRDIRDAAIGRVTYRPDGKNLRYTVTGLPIGGTVLVRLVVRPGRFPMPTTASASSQVPTLARADHSSPLYTLVLSADAPAQRGLDFRVAIRRDAPPAKVSVVLHSSYTQDTQGIEPTDHNI